MSVQACAELVARGDPDRFLATMAAPVAARAVLFPLQAFALEVARAPWVTAEPMIAEMRLQWWRDALEEIAEGRTVRRHEVVTPLAGVLSATLAARLDPVVEARRWDIYRDPFEDVAAFDAYIDETGATPVWVAAQALGAPEDAEQAVRGFARGAALARFLQAVPELEARGRIPLVDGRPRAVADLARAALAAMAPGYALRRSLGRVASAPLLEGWAAAPVLRRAARDPARVAQGRLELSPLHKRLRLMAMAAAGRWGTPSIPQAQAAVAS